MKFSWQQALEFQCYFLRLWDGPFKRGLCVVSEIALDVPFLSNNLEGNGTNISQGTGNFIGDQLQGLNGNMFFEEPHIITVNQRLTTNHRTS